MFCIASDNDDHYDDDDVFCIVLSKKEEEMERKKTKLNNFELVRSMRPVPANLTECFL